MRAFKLVGSADNDRHTMKASQKTTKAEEQNGAGRVCCALFLERKQPRRMIEGESWQLLCAFRHDVLWFKRWSESLLSTIEHAALTEEPGREPAELSLRTMFRTEPSHNVL